MSRCIWIIVTLLGATLLVGADEFDEFIGKEMAQHQIPGLVLKVIQSGRDLKTAAYGVGNVELNTPVQAETVFEIGSLTKQFTAACVLMLEREGRLSLDDRISKHLANTPAAWSNVTVRHLLAHSSGIKSYTGLDGFELTRHLTQAQFIQRLAGLPLEFPAGTQAKYCNSGYNLLGFVIENVSGQRYWSFLSARIWAPLGMTKSTNRDPEIIVTNRADGYVRRSGVLYNRDSDLTDVFSAGAIVSTIGDLSKWNAMLDGDSLLSASMRKQMWTPATLSDGSKSPYGFGWRIGEQDGHKNIGHSGSTSGFSASLQRYPEDNLAVIVLCNSDETNIATTVARGIARICLRGKESGRQKDAADGQ